jgi:catechol 2,3-dioxygenase-like lactoylglutathione lyase family enzyme
MNKAFLIFCIPLLLFSSHLISQTTPQPGLKDAPNSIMGFNHIGIVVQDLEKMVAFYQAATGFELVKREKVAGSAAADIVYNEKGISYETVTFKAHTMLLELTQFANPLDEPIQNMPPEGPGMTHTCYQSPSWKSGYQKFKNQKATILSRGDGPVDLGGYGVTYAYAYDPEGNMIEMEQLDESILNKDGYDANWQKQNNMWMTQVALISPDIKALTNYYVKILEFGPRREASLVNNAKLDDIAGLDNVELLAAWFGMDGQGKMMELMQYIHPKTATPKGKQPMKSLGYSFSFEVGDIHQEYKRLKALNVDFISEPQMLGEFWTVFAHDIDGNIFSLRQTISVSSIYSLKNFYD